MATLDGERVICAINLSVKVAFENPVQNRPPGTDPLEEGKIKHVFREESFV